jgi:hypothetical protein
MSLYYCKGVYICRIKSESGDKNDCADETSSNLSETETKNFYVGEVKWTLEWSELATVSE